MVRNYRAAWKTVICGFLALFLTVSVTYPAAALSKEELITLKTSKAEQQSRQKECMAYLEGLDIERESCLKREKTEAGKVADLAAQRRIAGRLTTRCAQYISEKEAALKTAKGAARLTLIEQKKALEQTYSEQEKTQERLLSMEQAHRKTLSEVRACLEEIGQEAVSYTGELTHLETSITELSAEITVADAAYADQVLSERAGVEEQTEEERQQAEDEWNAAVARAKQRWETYQKAQETLRSNESVIGAIGGATTAVVPHASLLWPVPTSQSITSSFGYRLHPLTGAPNFHRGLDIGASHGAEVLAADTGVVVASFYSSSYGNHIILAHENGTSTLYAHLSSSLVSVGMLVQRGETIGLVGSTGNATGDHLHFEFWANGSSNSNVNPLPYFSG